jgi:hypothetical protein
MKTYTLQLTPADLDVLLIALIDHGTGLRRAIRNERRCTNNTDTIDRLSSDRARVEIIMHQLKKQEEQP